MNSMSKNWNIETSINVLLLFKTDKENKIYLNFVANTKFI